MRAFPSSNDVPILLLNQPINSDWVRVCILGACLDLTVNFHHEHSIVPANCPWVSEDGAVLERWNVGTAENHPSTTETRNGGKLTHILKRGTLREKKEKKRKKERKKDIASMRTCMKSFLAIIVFPFFSFFTCLLK